MGDLTSNLLSPRAGTSIRISHVRAGRKQPGLRAQHTKGLQLIASICSGQLHGASVGSTEIILEPSSIRPGTFASDIGTAGSCTLLAQVNHWQPFTSSKSAAQSLYACTPQVCLSACQLDQWPSQQAAIPCLLMAADQSNNHTDSVLTSALDLRGGTDATMSPPIDYMRFVLLPMLARVFAKDVSLAPLHAREIACKVSCVCACKLASCQLARFLAKLAQVLLSKSSALVSNPQAKTIHSKWSSCTNFQLSAFQCCWHSYYPFHAYN